MLKYDLNLREYWRVIKRRKLIIIFTVVIMTIFSVFSSMMAKPTPIYRVTATVKVERNPSMFTGPNQFFVPANMETQTMMIRSYYVLELAAKKMGLIPADLPSEDVRNNPKYIGVILDLKDRVTATQEGNSDLINIEVKSHDPRFATKLANTLAEVYQWQHTEELNRRTREGKRFVESQFVTAREKMAKSEEAIKRFREENKWSSMEAESSALQMQIAKLREAYDKDRLTLEKVEMAARALEEAEHKPLTTRSNFFFDEASPPYRALNDKLVTMMMERDTLLLTYTENFPQVQALKSQIRETVQGMKSHLNAQRRALNLSIASTRNQLRDLETKLQQLPEKGLELTRLEREMSVNRELYTLLEKKYQEILIAEAEKIEEVKIVKPALEPEVPINPTSITKNVGLGSLMGLILGLVFAFLIETFDTSIGAVEEVEDFLGVHVLGIIPFVSLEEIRLLLGEDEKSKQYDERTLQRYARLASHFVPTSTLAESYKSFRTSINFVCSENNYKSLVFTSSSPGEGKTSITVNLAVTMAQAGYRVLLIDGDLRRPVLSSLFGIEQTPGLTDVIMGNYEWKAVVRGVSDLMMGKLTVDEIMKTPGLDNLFIITSGTYTPNPTEIVGSRTIAEIMKQFKEEYDMVLVDAPPVLAATDAALWSSLTDGTVMVYQVGKVARGALKRAKLLLQAVKANILGVVLNGIRAEITTDFGYHGYYYYRYGYGKEHRRKKRRWFQLSLPDILKKTSPIREGVAAMRRRKKEEAQEAEAPPSPKERVEVPPASSQPGLPLEWKREIPKGKIIKIVLAVLAVLFLALGVLYQFGYLKGILPPYGTQKKAVKTPKADLPPPGPATPPTADVVSPAVKAAVVQPQPGVPAASSPTPPAAPAGGPTDKKPAPEEKAPASPPAAETVKKAPEPPPSGPPKTSPAKGKAPVSQRQKPFAVKIASFQDHRQTEQLVSSLRGSGWDVQVTGVDLGEKGKWERVFVGRFATYREAERFKKAKGLDRRFTGSLVMKLEK